jgi:hypothetical protein
VPSQLIRIRSAQCTTDCGVDDTYRLRLWDTTLRGPRFNNANSQVTVLQVFNTSNVTVAGTAWFWSPAGTLLASHPIALTPYASMTFVTSSLPALAGATGSLTVTSNAPYGTLTGKAVALEPATGFSFDLVLEARPQ